MTKKIKRVRLSAAEYQMAKKRAACGVCKLSDDLKEQLVLARTRKMRVPEQLDWLREQYGIKLTRADFERHHSGRHEET